MRYGIPVPEEKPLEWMGSSHDDMCDLPPPVRQVLGRGLYQAQIGERARNAKVLQGFGGAGVLEVVDDYDGDTYRAVYTVRFARAVYALHVFQKKSTKGAETTKHDMETIRARLRAAEAHYRAHYEQGQG